MDKLLHTPEGVRDIYNSECAKKMQLEEKLRGRMHLYGFHDIQTPMFEFFDIFNKERGTVASKDMYKFFDREGNTLVLRPDITPSIARCIAKYYRQEEMPIRLSYCGSTFINNSSYQGKLKESTQLGAELINDASVEADAEMISLTIECLKDAGLDEFLVEIGHADFFTGLIKEAQLEEEEEEQLRNLIASKNMFGVEELLIGKKINQPVKDVILQLPELFGSIEKIKAVYETLQNQRARKAIERLCQLYEILESYGYEKYVSFDLGKLSKLNYYTGIIFHAMTYGTGEAIITGGRYDNLVSQFGKNAPAIGMAVLIDSLLLVVSRQKKDSKMEVDHTLILYHKSARKMAILLAKQFRSQAMKIELLIFNETKAVPDYVEYAKRMGIGGILHLHSEEEIDVIQAADGSVQKANIGQILSLEG